MRNYDMNGYLTCRSFRDTPDTAGNYDALLAAEGELFLSVADDNSVQGTLAFPAASLADVKRIMDVTGMVSVGEPRTLTLRAVGRAHIDLAGVAHDFMCAPTATWPVATHPRAAQRPALVGTAILATPQEDAAGVTTSVVAVKRDFHEPRDVPGVALIPEAVQLLASPRHQLQHTAWHLVRNTWARLSEDVRGRIGQLGWAIPDGRVPLDDKRRLVLGTGAGEHFLFMHRHMIGLVRGLYAKTVKEAIRVAVAGRSREPAGVHSAQLDAQPVRERLAKPDDRRNGSRRLGEFGDEWDDPSCDCLGDFYSSHAHPVFWRLLGRVDDRIGDWFQAHQAAHEGSVVRQTVRGTSWFATGGWVQVADP